jgi:NitT/TauT family transport system permease protein
MTVGMARKGRPVSRFWGVAGLLALAVLWEAGHRAYGALILPGLDQTAAALLRLSEEGRLVPALALTATHAGLGWLAAVGAGVAAGLFAGRSEAARLALQPVAVVLLGVPAIAWGVLALLWFGGGRAVVFTVAVATAPFVFAAALEGARSLDGGLARMARVFRTPTAARIRDVHGPLMLSHLFPALASTLAMSWKVAIMAELLAGAGGIGDGLAMSRVQVDTAATMAWILVVVGVLIAVDLALLRPVQRRMWLWRDAPGSDAR